MYTLPVSSCTPERMLLLSRKKPGSELSVSLILSENVAAFTIVFLIFGLVKPLDGIYSFSPGRCSPAFFVM